MTQVFPNIQRFAPKLRSAILAVAAVCGALNTSAFSLDTYAESSKLSSGHWVKVAITASGMYCIPEATLRSWGFANPEQVKIYGYGAKRLPDLMDDTYLDDLPQAASEIVSGTGLCFYAEGPTTWTSQSEGYYRPVQNPYTTTGYYFLSDTDDERLVPASTGQAGSGNNTPVTSFYDRVFHEVDRVSPGEAGFLLLGEDFLYTPSQTFNFQLPDLVESEPVRMETSFVSASVTGRSNLTFFANNTALPTGTSDSMGVLSDSYTHGMEAVSRKEFNVSGNNLAITIVFKTTISATLANLNYIAINYPRSLTLPAAKQLAFSLTSDGRSATLAAASAATRIWDITNPQNIQQVNATLSGTTATWSCSYTDAARDYVAWEPSASLPAPTLVGEVSKQNLHAIATPEMVIFTPSEWKSEAERLANFHRNSSVAPLDVLVMTPNEIYNEFSSGSPDAQAFRKVLKMFYDRGKQGDKQLKYALFFSRPTYDPRLLTTRVQALGYPMLPAWFTDKGLNDNDSYTTDDVFAFLEDNSGSSFGRDVLSIAVGRIPATSASVAKAAVDKIQNYCNKSAQGTWRNNFLLTADDQDSGEHMKQAERLYNSLMNSDSANDAFIKKLYTDEFELVSGRYPEARTRFYRYLDEGVLWWTYQGHASTTALSAEGLVTYTDLNALYLRHWPAVYAATCNFLRWDAASLSGAEIMFNNASGGVIAAISANRPVYITDNGYLAESFGKAVLGRDENGQIYSIGQAYQRAKNYYRRSSSTDRIVLNTNKLRYVLLGDPAMHLLMPSNRVQLDTIGNVPVEELGTTDTPATLMARQQTTIKGRITDAAGTLLSNFNGVITGTLYDAEESVTTRGNGDEGEPVTFQRQGGRLFIGTDSIKNGEFTMKVVMPAEVKDNYTPAAFNLYAYSDNGDEAISVCRNLYVYGIDNNADTDDEPPVITSIYINHPSFQNGQEVNSSPMLMATVSDNLAINLSTAGIGHQMTISLDGGSETYTDVADYFTPFTDGTPGGTICYPFDDLAQGAHTMTLRVWDTAPNSAEASVDFVVAKTITPTIYDVYTDRNPVSDEANFYISHDRPDGTLTVTIEVFNLLGRCLWSTTETGRSDMFTSSPITWDLMDSGGHRVPRGIYLYRATVSDSDSGTKTATAARKLAVTGVQ
jgi:hypothetical protein